MLSIALWLSLSLSLLVCDDERVLLCVSGSLLFWENNSSFSFPEYIRFTAVSLSQEIGIRTHSESSQIQLVISKLQRNCGWWRQFIEKAKLSQTRQSFCSFVKILGHIHSLLGHLRSWEPVWGANQRVIRSVSYLITSSEKRKQLRAVGARRCTSCYEKQRRINALGKRCMWQKKIEILRSDCDKFFVLIVWTRSIILWNEGLTEYRRESRWHNTYNLSPKKKAK